MPLFLEIKYIRRQHGDVAAAVVGSVKADVLPAPDETRVKITAYVGDGRNVRLHIHKENTVLSGGQTVRNGNMGCRMSAVLTMRGTHIVVSKETVCLILWGNDLFIICVLADQCLHAVFSFIGTFYFIISCFF